MSVVRCPAATQELARVAPLLRLHDGGAGDGPVPIDSGPESLPELPELRLVSLPVLPSGVVVFRAAAIFGRVEVTVAAHGSLYAKEGAPRVLAQSTGRSSALVAEPGQVVRAGQVLARIEAHELAA